MIQMRLPYPPSVNVYWRSGRGHTYLSKEGRAYKQAVKYLGLAAGVRPLDGDVVFTMHLFRPRKVGDLDNRIKGVLDALEGVAFADDAQVVEMHVFRHDDKDDPRAEVKIEEV